VIEKENLYLAFFVGLLLSHLTSTPLGFYSLMFLSFVQITHLFSKSRFFGNFWSVVPLTLVILSVNALISSYIFHQSLQIWPKVVLESVFSLPLFIVIKFWEERFIVKDLRLKI
jgi:cell shape-determining protein MreD